MKAKRARTRSQVETDVLTSSMRRCAFCFGINNDFSEKPGQIAHVDGNRSNSSFNNLAWLCLEHHDRFDSSTSQSKGLTRNELKAYRERLFDFVKQTRRDASTRFISDVVKSPSESKASVETVDSTATEYNQYLIDKWNLKRNGKVADRREPQPARITTLNKSNDLNLGSNLDWHNNYAEISGKRVDWIVLVVDVSRALAPDGEYIIVHSQLTNGGDELDWYFEIENWEQNLRELECLDIMHATGIIDSLGYVRNCEINEIRKLTPAEYENLPVTPNGLESE